MIEPVKAVTFNDVLTQDAYDRAVLKFFLQKYRFAPQSVRDGLIFNPLVIALEKEFRRGWNTAAASEAAIEKLAIISTMKFRRRPPGACF